MKYRTSLGYYEETLYLKYRVYLEDYPSFPAYLIAEDIQEFSLLFSSKLSKHDVSCLYLFIESFSSVP